MSGIDQYTRFYWSVDEAGNLAESELTALSGEAWWEYNWDTQAYDIPQGDIRFPLFQSGYSDSNNDPEVAGKFSGEVGYRFYSALPSDGETVTRVNSCWLAYDSEAGPPGFSALGYGDYTIDFWLKINPGAGSSQIQTLIYNSNNDWSLFYNNGVLGQVQGASHSVTCAADFSDQIFHHIEINRSYGINRIFIDGVLQTLITDTWNPIFLSLIHI